MALSLKERALGDDLKNFGEQWLVGAHIMSVDMPLFLANMRDVMCMRMFQYDAYSNCINTMRI